MSFIDRALEKMGLARKSALPPAISNMGGGDIFAVWQNTKKMSADKAFGVNNNWVYTCVRAIAEEIASVRFHLYKIGADGKSKEITDHELLDLIEGVNNYQTSYEIFYTLASHLELTGDAFWLLDGAADANGKPTAIYPLNPRHIRVLRGNTIQEPVRGYVYNPGVEGQSKVYLPGEILHFRLPDPNDPIQGMGTVQAAAEWIDTDNYATEFNRMFFVNGARLAGMLESTQSLTIDQLKFLKASFEDAFKGSANAYKVAALPHGTKFVESGVTQKDMDFVNGSMLLRDKILSAFRVPKTVLGSSESETNRATAETANYVFALRTIKPKLRLITSYLNEFLVPRYGSDLYLDFENVVPADRAVEITEMTAALGGQPSLSVNEARERYLNKGPVENGEDVMTDYSHIPLGAPSKGQKALADSAVVGKVIRTRHAKNAARRRELTESISENAAKAVTDLVRKYKKIKKKSIAELTDEEYDVVHKAFVSRVTPFEKAMEKVIVDFNEKQTKEVLGNLSSATKKVDADKLFDFKDWVGILADLARPILTDLYEKEGTEAAALLGRDDIKVVTPEVKKKIDRSVELMSETYNTTTRDLLKLKLEEGIDAGMSQAELADEIKTIQEFSDEKRALTVARTETFRTANDATRDVWKASGIVKEVKWYTAADERVCEYCGPMHGTTVSIDENFFNKGDELEGSDGGTLKLDYDDVAGGALHPNCRCYTRPEKIEI